MTTARPITRVIRGTLLMLWIWMKGWWRRRILGKPALFSPYVDAASLRSIAAETEGKARKAKAE